MIKINELNTRLGSIVELQCTLGLICDSVRSADGDTWRRVIVDDATGELDIYVNVASPLFFILSEAAELLAPIQISIYLRMLDGRVVGDLRAIKALDTDEVVNAAALIPQIDCPGFARDALSALVAFNDNLRPLALREFLNFILTHELFVAALLSAQSDDERKHDANPSFLVRAMTAVELTAELSPNLLNATEAAVAQLTAFLHTFGAADTEESHNPLLGGWAKEYFQVQLTLLTFISPDIGKHLKRTLERISVIDPGDYCSGIAPIDFVHFSRLPITA